MEKEGKLEEGGKSRTEIWLEMKKNIEGKGIFSQYYCSVCLGAMKPMRFLGPTHGPAHDEIWSA